MNKLNLHCRSCGLEQASLESFWGEDNSEPSFMICDCCGVEFGNEDIDRENVIGYRKNWLEKGAKWFNETKKPTNWNLSDQLKQIPENWL